MEGAGKVLVLHMYDYLLTTFQTTKFFHASFAIDQDNVARCRERVSESAVDVRAGVEF